MQEIACTLERAGWIPGILDSFLQVGRSKVPGFDGWVIMALIIGSIVMVFIFPLPRQMLSSLIEVLKTIWKQTAPKKKTAK